MSKLERGRRADAKRKANPARAWYKLKAWCGPAGRRMTQLRAEPTCRFHRLELGAIVPATTVDHVIPHRGDEDLFWRGELQSLCGPCHDRHKQREELEGFSRGVGEDGFPTDPRHPFRSA